MLSITLFIYSILSHREEELEAELAEEKEKRKKKKVMLEPFSS